MKLTDLLSLRRALSILHTRYKVPNVVISSIPLKSWLLDALPAHIRPAVSEEGEGYLLCISSSWTAGVGTLHAHCVPLIPGYFSGVGDLFSALLLGHFHPLPASTPATTAEGETPLSRATTRALTLTHSLLALTYAHSLTLPPREREATDDEKDMQDPGRRIRRMRGRELRIVQGQGILRGERIKEEERTMQVWAGFWESGASPELEN